MPLRDSLLLREIATGISDGETSTDATTTAVDLTTTAVDLTTAAVVASDEKGVKAVHADRFQATITSADASTATQIKAKTAAKKMHILGIVISSDTLLNLQLQDDTGTPVVLMEQIYVLASTTVPINFPKEAPLVVDTNKDLDIIASGAGNISVYVTGYLAD